MGKEKVVNLSARAERAIPGGVNSNIRFEMPKVFFDRGSGCRMWDIDGNEYVDYLLGQGPLLLGHSPKKIRSAVEASGRRGTVFGGQNVCEVEAAELMIEVLQWPDAVRLAMTGTEAVQAAIRLARAHTGRSRVVRFEDHYHGWVDTVLIGGPPTSWLPEMRGQSEAARSDLLVVPWNNPHAVRAVFQAHADEIAAVITEPFMFNTGGISARPGYLELLRSLCDETGAVLIFDEVISGFRVALGGAVEVTGVTPDLAVYGKSLGSGWPVAAVAGSAEVMAEAASGSVLLAGTFNGNLMSAAAAAATLRELRDHPPYEGIAEAGTALMAGLVEVGEQAGLPIRVQGLPAVFHASFGPAEQIYESAEMAGFDRQRYKNFSESLVARGIWASSRGTWFLSSEHSLEDIAQTLDAAALAAQDLK